MRQYQKFLIKVLQWWSMRKIFGIINKGRSHGGGDNFEKCSEKNYLKIFLLCHYFVLTGILKPHS